MINEMLYIPFPPAQALLSLLLQTSTSMPLEDEASSFPKRNTGSDAALAASLFDLRDTSTESYEEDMQCNALIAELNQPYALHDADGDIKS